MEQIRTQIRNFILNEFLPGEAAGNLPNDIPLRESAILDSLGLLKMITFIESSFSIEIGPLDAGDTNFGTINRIATFVDSQLRAH